MIVVHNKQWCKLSMPNINLFTANINDWINSENKLRVISTVCFCSQLNIGWPYVTEIRPYYIHNPGKLQWNNDIYVPGFGFSWNVQSHQKVNIIKINYYLNFCVI